MKNLICLILASFVCLSLQLSNNGAQACFSDAVNSNKCAQPLSECYSNAECQKQVGSFPCDFLNNDNLFNGNCFKHWQDNAVYSKDLINCLIDACDLTSNSKHNMTKFFQCNSEVIHSIKGLQCDQNCYDALTIVMQCMQQQPVQQCYAGQNSNKEADRVVKAIRGVCLQGNTIEQIIKQTKSEVEGEL